MKVYFKNSSFIKGKSYGKGWHDLPNEFAKTLIGARGITVIEPVKKPAPKRKKK